MIKVSKLADYAVVVLAALVEKPLPVSAADVGAETGMPVPTVAKVLKLLAKAGIVTGARGVSGGYSLMMPAEGLSIARIVTAVDGPINVTECVNTNERCAVGALCSLHGRWGKVNLALINALNNVTLRDLMSAPKREIAA